MFVDASGRRQRRVRRAGRILAIPAAGYVVLLLSTALGGPSVNAPYLPLPAAPHHAKPAATTGDLATPTGAATGRDTSRTGAPTKTSAGSSPSAAAPTASAVPVPTGAPSSSPSPSATRGKSGTVRPTPSHTNGHGAAVN